MRILPSRIQKTFTTMPKTVINAIRAFFIMALCYGAVGCATLQDLEPTAIFIANIKDIL
ncbi:hypothetical protein [Psychrobacter sp. 16-MNA-CIBAN-0192]|uniref:hypothetical protein n=1 Tax=Psychrobacter sp. 16-MNA-CIBAN-0192 TaxID=3140448 RepID=UPI003326C76D